MTTMAGDDGFPLPNSRRYGDGRSVSRRSVGHSSQAVRSARITRRKNPFQSGGFRCEVTTVVRQSDAGMTDNSSYAPVGDPRSDAAVIDSAAGEPSTEIVTPSAQSTATAWPS